jgi:hypothetical protein
MIYDLQSLKIKYKDYKNLNQKISIECKKGNLTRIKKGLYSDNLDLDKLVIANICYEPSYISFEYALSYYGLIPEYVSVITSATFNKKNNKRYVTNTQIFEYKSIPNDAYHYGIVFQNNEEGIKYKIASKEKALCDLLYIKKPVRSIKDLKILLFEDLRIDEEYFWSLNFNSIRELMNKYHSNNIKLLIKYTGEKHDNN